MKYYLFFFIFFFPNCLATYAQVIPDNFVLNTYNIELGAGGSDIEAADIDGDGIADLIISFPQYVMAAPGSTIGFVRIIQTVPNSFSYCLKELDSTDIHLPERPYAMTIADLDNDGKKDIVLVAKDANLVYVLKNNCTPGNITTAGFALTSYPTAYSPYDVAIADVDNDNKPDIITSNISNFSVLKNISSTGTITASSFATKVDFTVNANHNTIAVGDLDGDGKKDVIIAGSYETHSDSLIFIFTNQATIGVINAGSFSAPITYVAGYEPIAPVISDLNKDGKPEIIVANSNSTSSPNRATIFINSTTPGTIDVNSFSQKGSLSITVNGNSHVPITLVSGDLDSDGNPDLIFGDSYQLIIYINEITGSTINENLFSKYSLPATSSHIAVADLEGDLANDIACVDKSSTFLDIYDNNYFITPLPVVVLVTPTQTKGCPGDNTTFHIPNVDSHYTYQWIEYPLNGGAITLTNAGPYSGVNSPVLTLLGITKAMAGSQYKCYINGNCSGGALSDDGLLTLSAPPLVVSGPSDVAVSENTSALFSVLTSGDSLRFQWQEDKGSGFQNMIVSPYCSNVTGFNLSIDSIKTTMNGYKYRCILYGSCDSITISNASALTVTQASIENEYNVKVFEILSPNGDDKNETFYIENLDKFPDNEISVFNKWGQRVFYQQDYQNNWQGDNLSDGAYLYVVKIKKNDKTFKGSLIIRR